MLAKHALYQLSYGPFEPAHGEPSSDPRQSRNVVGPGRLELPTLRLSGVRSNHLSYGPIRPLKTVNAPGLAIAPPA